MAYYATELATPPPVTLPGGGVLQEKVGTGYPSGTPLTPAYYPNSPLPAATSNPSGVPNSPDEYPAVGTPPGSIRYAYSPQTWEEKAAAMVPPGEFAVPVDFEPNEPYP